MFKLFKKPSYDSLIVPDEIYIENFDFKAADPEKAKRFSEWYFAQTKDRIAFLQRYIKKRRGKVRFDYSEDSLVQLWTWFEENLEMVDKTFEELEYEKSRTPEAFWKCISPKRISHLMIEIAMDISYYFVDMLLCNFPNLRTDCITKPKWKESLKEPVVAGFTMDIILNPIDLIIKCAKRSGEEKNPYRLKMLYDKYSDYARDPFELKYDSVYPYWVIAPYFEYDELFDCSQASKKTTDAFFHNYVAQSESRINAVFEYIESDNVHIDMDFTPESLIPLWDWARRKIRFRQLTEKEMIEKKLNLAPWFRNSNYMHNKAIDGPSCQLLIDISYYYAEVVLKNFEGAKWSYFTNGKKYISVNRPIIVFPDTKFRFEPNGALFKATLKLDDDRALYNAFSNIEELIIAFSKN